MGTSETLTGQDIDVQDEEDVQTGDEDNSSLVDPQANGISDEDFGNALVDDLGLTEVGDSADASTDEADTDEGDGASDDDTEDTSEPDDTSATGAPKVDADEAQLPPEVADWMSKVGANKARIAEVPGKLRAPVLEQMLSQEREAGRAEIADGTKFVPYSDAEQGVNVALMSGREEGYVLGQLHAEFEGYEYDQEARQQLIDSDEEKDIAKAQAYTMWKSQGKTFMPKAEPAPAGANEAAAAINEQARVMLSEARGTPGLFEAVQVVGKAEKEQFGADARSLARLSVIIERERAKIETGTTDDNAAALAESDRRRVAASKRKGVPKVDASGEAESRTPTTDVEREMDVDTLLSVGLALER